MTLRENLEGKEGIELADGWYSNEAFDSATSDVMMMNAAKLDQQAAHEF